MLNIEIKEIRHREQRYETVGDYFLKKSKICFRISHMKDWRYVVLVAVHELVEWAIVKRQGISIKEIDAFDIQYEKDREQGIHTEDTEPGDDPKAPYFYAHQLATKIEKELALALQVDWYQYDEVVMSL